MPPEYPDIGYIPDCTYMEGPEKESRETEISEQPYWHNLPKDGGGDIDLADY